MNSSLTTMTLATVVASFAIGVTTTVTAATPAPATALSNAWLGMRVRAATAVEVRRAGLPRKLGVTVIAVFDDSPAAAAGLLPGDLIARVGNDWIEDGAQFT